MQSRRILLESFIFSITFFLGYFCRFVNFGWLMFLFAIPEYLFRSMYYVGGMYILEKNRERNHIAPIILLQCLYLLTSFFSYDGADASSYTFAHLWINPPKSIIMPVWGTTAALTIIVFMIFFIKNLKQPATFKVNACWFFKNITLGCVLIPALAILLILLPSLTRTI